MAKTTDGVFWKRREDKTMIFYYKLGREKSKDYLDQRQCAMDFITKYIERNPKYIPVVEEKSWDEIMKIFGIRLIGT